MHPWAKVCALGLIFAAFGCSSTRQATTPYQIDPALLPTQWTEEISLETWSRPPDGVEQRTTALFRREVRIRPDEQGQVALDVQVIQLAGNPLEFGNILQATEGNKTTDVAFFRPDGTRRGIAVSELSVGLFLPLPNHEISIGDTWTAASADAQFGEETPFELTGINPQGHWLISVREDTPGSFDSMVWQLLVDNRTFRILELELKIAQGHPMSLLSEGFSRVHLQVKPITD